MSTSCRPLDIGSTISIWREDEEKSGEGKFVKGVIENYQIKKKYKHDSNVLYTIQLFDGSEIHNRLGNNLPWKKLPDEELETQDNSNKRKQSDVLGH